MMIKINDKYKNTVKSKKKRKGKVIRHFTVEAVSADSDPELFSNSANMYTGLSDEERLKDLVDIFGLLWAETCRDASEREEIDRKIKAIRQKKKQIE
ncbi:MAG: hypothetical protein KC684_00625 [Candidatus Omnitrophica bacterium]|nr:hypothetical protein [Candidatus Omnitrophota bacterium]